MAEKTPLRLVFDGGTPTGIAEYQTGDTIGNSFLTNSSFNVLDDTSTSTSISLGNSLQIIGTGGITTSLTGSVLTIAVGGSIVTETSTDTLTNKTIDSANNTLTLDLSEGTLTGTTAEFNTALSDGSFATLAGSETLTNKTINGSNNTLSNIGNSSLTNSTITVSGDSGTQAVDLGDTLTVQGTTNEIETSVSGDTITVGLPDDVTIGNNLTITGDLTVNGTTTTLATTNSTVTDTLIELGNGITGTPGNDSGIIIERGDADNAFIGFDESADKFIVGTGSFTGASTGNLTISTGTIVANLEATTATLGGSDVISTDNTKTLTNKTFNLSNNTLTGTTAEFNTALSDGSFATLVGSETLTNKTINGSNNTLSNIGNASLSNSTITITGDSGSNAVDLGDTLNISGDTGITTTVAGDSVSVDLDDTAVTPGSYGSTTSVPTFTVDQQGRLTAADEVSVATTLTVADDSSTNANISLLTDTLTVSGTSNEIETSITGSTLTIGLPDNVTIGNNLTVTGNSVLQGNITLGVNSGDSTEDTITINGRFVSNLEPLNNITYDLGSPNRRWRDLYLSGNTIDIGGAQISGDGTGQILISATGATLPIGSKVGTDTIASADSNTGVATRNVPFFTKQGGLSTAAKTFKFSAGSNNTVFQANHTYTLANGTNTSQLALFVF